MIGLNKIGLNQVQLNRLRLNAPFPAYGKMAGGGGSGDGFPQLPGDVTRWHFGGLTNEMMAAMDDPRIEDADGKGRFLSFKNFAWKEGSGISDVYPGALVFDGVDDYGICDNLPILTKEKGYTVVALRKWLTPENKTNNEVLVANLKGENWNILNLGAFGCEIKYNKFDPKIVRALSFGQESKININENDLLFYQTSNSYNGVNLASGIGSNGLGGSFLIVGSGDKTSYHANAAIWELIILDHDATEEELTKIKNYFIKTYPWLFFDQAWTVVGKSNEDTDRATIANITGNGNNLVLSNFGFAGNSGYGEYPTTKSKYEFSYEIIALRFTPTDNIKNIRIKFVLTGLSEANGEQFAMTIRNSQDKQIDKEIYTKDGTYVFTYEYTGEDQISVWGYSWVKNSETNYTVDIVPEYEGYLVTDGVDDKITSSAFKMGKDFTIVGEWEFIKETVNKNSGIWKPNSFALNNFTFSNQIMAYIKSIISTSVYSKGVKALASDGKLYKDFNSEQELVVGNEEDRGTGLYIGYFVNIFNKIAFKNLAIYPRILSKDDCIKAYNYLQTLKAK